MTNVEDRLGRTQAQSLVVGLVTTGLLGLQNLLVLQLVSRDELGLLGIASALGTAALIVQYFGVGAATLKEVALARTKEEAGEIMLAAAVLRILLTLPFAIALLALAGWFAGTVYDHPEIETPVRLFAAVIVLYGLTDVFMYTLQGLHAWRHYFAIKLVAAVLQTGIVLGATAAWGLDGYFIGITAAAGVGVVLALLGALSRFGFRLPSPRRTPMRRHMRAMLSLSVYAYVAKLFQGLVTQLPLLIGGAFYAASTMGDLKFALTLGGLLLTVASAVNTINIAVFSRRFDRQRESFAAAATHQVVLYSLVSGVAGAAGGLLVPELISLVGGGRYHHAAAAAVVAMAATVVYGMIGVLVSTVHIPAGAYRTYVWLYLLPCLVTGGIAWALASDAAPVWALAASVLAGSAAAIVWAAAELPRHGVAPWGLAGLLLAGLGAGSLPALSLPLWVRLPVALAVLGAAALAIRRVAPSAQPAA